MCFLTLTVEASKRKTVMRLVQEIFFNQQNILLIWLVHNFKNISHLL